MIKIDQHLKEQGLKHNNASYNLYYTIENRKILVLYRDDLLLTRSHKDKITWLKLHLETMFQMINLGNLKLYPGVEFIKLDKRINS